MTLSYGSEAADARKRDARRRRIIYVIGLVLVGVAGWSLAAAVLRAPPRSSYIVVGGVQLRVTVTMVPDPPKTGPIPTEVVISDDAGTPIAVDEVVVRYGMDGGASDSRVAAPGASAGLYRTRIEFGNVGKGWVEIVMRRGREGGLFRFPVDVRPNI